MQLTAEDREHGRQLLDQISAPLNEVTSMSSDLLELLIDEELDTKKVTIQSALLYQIVLANSSSGSYSGGSYLPQVCTLSRKHYNCPLVGGQSLHMVDFAGVYW